MTGIPTDSQDAAEVRHLLRLASAGALGTLTANGEPYVSYVEMASDIQGNPLFLLSDLAQHTKNIRRDAAASLLIGDVFARPASLADARVSLVGRIVATDDPQPRARYLARHPHAQDYVEMRDFHFYRFELGKAHLVAGFGRIAWVDAQEVLLPDSATEELASSEQGVIEHMNEDHADAIELYATALAGAAPGGWTMTGVDPEGFDLWNGQDRLRLGFESSVGSSSEVRVALVEMVKKARRAGAKPVCCSHVTGTGPARAILCLRRASGFGYTLSQVGEWGNGGRARLFLQR